MLITVPPPPIEKSAYVRDTLDGCGGLLKNHFTELVRGENRVFETAFEWCAGIGEIGMEVLRAGLCKRLVLADINPKAIDVARQIAARDGFSDKIDFFVGDNMGPVPKDFRFDLVLGNPPNYFNIQQSHPIGAAMVKDLRPNDRGWKIHEAFYAAIPAYLAPDAVMFIHEVEPYKKEVFIGHDTPYDLRDEAPIETFKRMTAASGLKITDVIQLTTLGGVGLYGLKIVRA